jgi:hypothetical protein
VEKEYRRFLCLMKMYPDEDTAPLVDVDTFWHYHILDTMKYAADCEQAFGYFLHHYPYVGMRGDDDEQFRLDSGDRMRELYEATFGETYPGAVAQAADGVTAWCASPHIEAREGAIAASSYCASPRTAAGNAATAWCASPHTATDKAATAWCASPHTPTDKAATAWCASPHTATAKAATAWCASPHIDKLTRRVIAGTGAATAWCASPHTAAKAAA